MPATKDQRINIRLSPENKELIQRAADRRGVSITAFVTWLAVEGAAEVERESERIVMSRAAFEHFHAAVTGEEGNEPNEALRRAAEEFNQGYFDEEGRYHW